MKTSIFLISIAVLLFACESAPITSSTIDDQPIFIPGTQLSVSDLSTLPLDTSCEDAEKWAIENMNRFQVDINTISALPLTYRRSVYSRTSPATKAYLWQNHLEQFLHTDLSRSQEKALKSILNQIQPELYAPDSPGKLENEELFAPERLRQLFGAEKAWEMFATLGPGRSDSGEILRPTQLCECSMSSNWCWGPPGVEPLQDCLSSSCTSTILGCGTLWLSTCNGDCEVF